MITYRRKPNDVSMELSKKEVEETENKENDFFERLENLTHPLFEKFTK